MIMQQVFSTFSVHECISLHSGGRGWTCDLALSAMTVELSNYQASPLMGAYSADWWASLQQNLVMFYPWHLPRCKYLKYAGIEIILSSGGAWVA